MEINESTVTSEVEWLARNNRSKSDALNSVLMFLTSPKLDTVAGLPS